MALPMNMGKDVEGHVNYTLPFTNLNYATTLSQGVQQTLTLPTEHVYYDVIFFYQPGTTVFVSDVDSVSLPGGSFALTVSHGKPAGARVKGGAILRFICADTTAIVGVTLYAVQP